MEARRAVFGTYELLEQILGNLDRVDLDIVEQVDRQWRFVARSSNQIAKKLAGIAPLHNADIKPLSDEQKKWFDEKALTRQWRQLPRFFAFERHPLRPRSQKWDRLYLDHLTYLELFDPIALQATPHYAFRDLFTISPHIQIVSKRGNSTLGGTRFEIRMPTRIWALGSPADTLTEPPITTVRMELRISEDVFMDEEECLSTCFLHVPTGIKLRDMMQTQEAMLNSFTKTTGEPRVFAIFLKGTDTARLRSIDALKDAAVAGSVN